MEGKAMAKEAAYANSRRVFPWRLLGWSIPAVLLVLPLIAMRFTNEVNWTGSDFLFAAVLFGSVGLAFELIVRKSGSLAYRLAAVLGVMGAFLAVWVNGAVGMIGSEDNPYNLLFLAVPLVALAGGIAARFRASGMVWAMGAAAGLQAGLGLFGMAEDPLGGTFSTILAAPWLLGAALFAMASWRQEAP
jgi:hypothetical protein